MTSSLLTIYLPLIGWTGLGWLLGRRLPKAAPNYLGKFLFWFGIPLGIVAFLRHTQLSMSIWMAPVVAWMAVFLGIGLARLWLLWCDRTQSQPTQGSFILACMIGNTGYIGFPVSLALVGRPYFAWALFYDLLGSTLAAYGLGVAMAGWLTQRAHPALPWRYHLRQALLALVKNPALWSFGVGVVGREVPLPVWAETSLQTTAWGIVSLSLVLVGMRLSQLSSLRHLKPALVSISIKMIVVPLTLGMGLWLFGIHGPVHRAILLQMAMPPAFATLVISEAYALDQDFAVTAIAAGCIGLLITLPLWLTLFGA